VKALSRASQLAELGHRRESLQLVKLHGSNSSKN
jgi:hypothetical protein